MLATAHDPLCARTIERALKVVACAGYVNSAAIIGAPDVELLTLTEMVDHHVADDRRGGPAGFCGWRHIRAKEEQCYRQVEEMRTKGGEP